MPRSRALRLYLEDVLEASRKLRDFTKGMSYEEFLRDEKTKDAVLRNLEVIGEAAKNLPEDFKTAWAEVEWKKAAGMRNKLIHEYFGVSPQIVWETLKNDIPKLEHQVKNILEALEKKTRGG